MENNAKLINASYFWKIFQRRKWSIIIPIFISLPIAFGVYKYLPKVYKAATVILVQPQRVPETYVRSTTTTSVADRLNTISQEILSRSNLERVIREYNLYSEIRDNIPMEEVIEKMRKLVDVRVQSRSGTQTTFSVGFEGNDPKQVMAVTNTLASMFIEENLRVRETQAENTSDFLSKELKSVETELKKKEEDLRAFRERNMGQLPQQLDANLRILEGLQQRLQMTRDGIRIAEDRNIVLRSQIEELQKRETTQMTAPNQPPREVSPVQGGVIREAPHEEPEVSQLNSLRSELETARARYTENHPDVVSLKRKISILEPKVMETVKKREAEVEGQRRAALEREERIREARAREAREGESRPQMVTVSDPVVERQIAQYTEQYNLSVLEGKRLREEEINLRQQLSHYQKRIEDTPRREQEFSLLTRDYDLLKANYQSLLDKKMQAQMAENLERKQQGEQFKVLDPARMPEKPIRPDMGKILLMGAALGVMTGIGLAWIKESLDQTFHDEDEVGEFLGLPVLGLIPSLDGNEERKPV